MPKVSVDYMNARRASKPASSGRRYTLDRNIVDDKAAFAALDVWDQEIERGYAMVTAMENAIAEQLARRNIEHENTLTLLRGVAIEDTNEEWFR